MVMYHISAGFAMEWVAVRRVSVIIKGELCNEDSYKNQKKHMDYFGMQLNKMSGVGIGPAAYEYVVNLGNVI